MDENSQKLLEKLRKNLESLKKEASSNLIEDIRVSRKACSDITELAGLIKQQG